MNDIETEVLDQLRDADGEKEILDAVSQLSGTNKTVESHALVSAAGAMLADELERGESS